MEQKNLLQVENLTKYFKSPAGELHAVENVSFSIQEGTTLGVLGESGCGKSTLGRTIIGLIEKTGGKIVFDGEEMDYSDAKVRRRSCCDLQIIFQDPFSSLDPRMCVFDIIAEPFLITKRYKKKEIEPHVRALMDEVGLSSRFIYAYPHEMDGGRRQRIGIARALAMNPRLIVCDEPVSALDVSIQAQILNLLKGLQIEKKLTYIFITHDMSVVKHISQEILVMYMGCVAEKCPTQELFEHNLHPYTKGLLAAIPVPDIHHKREKILLSGEITSPINPAPGCRFAPRCPYAKGPCFAVNPELKEVSPGHMVACHFVSEINSL